MQCIRMNQIKLPLGHSREELEEKIQKRLGIKREALEHYEIIRQSIDARKKARFAICIFGGCLCKARNPDK